MKRYIFTVILFTTSLQAQNLDSLYNLLISSRKSIKNLPGTTQINEKKTDKCGFGLFASVRSHLKEFSIEQQQTIEEVMSRPELSQSIISPSGIFKLHYDDSGINKPEYSVEELAVAFDSSYSFEINYLGYPPPPSDGTTGGDAKYDIYIVNLSGGLYGATTPETKIENTTTYNSYIEIDNSFRQNEGYNTYGINAARATAAHEFHHAIQLGGYIFREDDLFYYELTSTAFEEFVYDDVNDYYAYMWSYFRNPTNKLESNSGYNIAIWNIFLNERFKPEDILLGHKIVKRSWEYMINDRAVIAIAKAMVDYGKSFSNEFNVFGDWLYFTNTNTKDGKFFEEASNYPKITSTYTLELENSKKTINIQSVPTSINILTFTDFSQGFADTIVAVLSNSDVLGSVNNTNTLDVEFSLHNGEFEGAKSINETYYSKITTDFIGFVQSSYIINNELSYNQIPKNGIDFAYPQPFNYEINNVVHIPSYTDLTNRADLNIYSSDMNLVYSGNEPINSNNNNVVWNGMDNNGNKLASGVYIYVTKADGKIKKGKLVILK